MPKGMGRSPRGRTVKKPVMRSRGIEEPEATRSSKNIFRSYRIDRLSLLIIDLIFYYLKNEIEVSGEFHFSTQV